MSRFDWRIGLALAGTYAFFGSGPAATAAAIRTLPPFLMVGTRGLLAGALLVAWALAAGAPRPSPRQCARSAVIGTLILACGAGAGTYGQLTVPSGVAGVLSALLPLLAAILGYLLFRERPSRRTLIGLGIGFAGIGLLLRPGSQLDPFGVLLIVFGQVGWALAAELAPRLDLPEDPRLAAGLELLAGGALLTLGARLIGGEAIDWPSVSTPSWIGFGWFTLAAIGGFTAFGFLSQHVPPSMATTFSYVNPVVAVALGWLLYGEAVTTRMVLATLVVVTGVCLIVSQKGAGGDLRDSDPADVEPGPAMGDREPKPAVPQR